jgi:hypothetical protein
MDNIVSLGVGRYSSHHNFDHNGEKIFASEAEGHPPNKLLPVPTSSRNIASISNIAPNIF